MLFRSQFGAHLEQETSCFAASGSRRLLQKFDFHPLQAQSFVVGAQHAAPFEEKTVPNIAELSDRPRATSVRSRQPKISLFRCRETAARQLRPDCACRDGNSKSLRPHPEASRGSPPTSQAERVLPLDPAQGVLPGLAHIDENWLFALIQTRLHIRRCDFQIIHLFSLPNRRAFFKERANPFSSIFGLHQLR